MKASAEKCKKRRKINEKEKMASESKSGSVTYQRWQENDISRRQYGVNI